MLACSCRENEIVTIKQSVFQKKQKKTKTKKQKKKQNKKPARDSNPDFSVLISPVGKR